MRGDIGATEMMHAFAKNVNAALNRRILMIYGRLPIATWTHGRRG